MNRVHFAKILGKGVEIAALLSFAEANDCLESASEISINERCSDIECGRVRGRVLPIQLLQEEGGKVVELKIEASDGAWEEAVYFYARERPAPAAWGLLSEADMRELERRKDAGEL